MAAEGWQDDARFATSLARMRAGSGYGPIRIRAEPGTHGLDAVVIVQAFAALAEAGEDDWRRQARHLVRRRFSPVERLVGKTCVSTCRSRWLLVHYKKHYMLILSRTSSTRTKLYRF